MKKCSTGQGYIRKEVTSKTIHILIVWETNMCFKVNKSWLAKTLVKKIIWQMHQFKTFGGSMQALVNIPNQSRFLVSFLERLCNSLSVLFRLTRLGYNRRNWNCKPARQADGGFHLYLSELPFSSQYCWNRMASQMIECYQSLRWTSKEIGPE